MEKRFSGIKRVVITGPESTGKTILSEQLAKKYDTVWIPEYARYYVENLNRKYTYEDVEKIAVKQVELEQDYALKANKILFYDTFLIITKVWFKFVYNRYPEWIHKKIAESDIDLFLLCDIDIPWKSDSVRENGGEMRKVLFEMYVKEICDYGFGYEVINGECEARLNNAEKFINGIL